MKALVAIVGLALLAGCPSPSPSPSPIPSPVPSPSVVPTPSPTPRPSPSASPVLVPTGAYDCAHPEALSGFVKVTEPTGKYIVRLKTQGVRMMSGQVKAMAESMGATNVRALARGFSATMTVTSALAAAGRSDVQYVSEDGKKHVLGRRSVKGIRTLAATPWSLDRIDQRALPLDGKFTPLNDGAGVKVIVIDTGIVPQPDFAGRVAAENFTAFAACNSPQDHPHGTFVASEIAGTTYGVAKKATVVCDRVLDVDGSGSDSDVIAGVEWAAQQKQAHPAQPYVASMSLGGGPAPALDQAVCDAMAVGLPFAIAAGNESADASTSSPARVWQAVTVAASDDTDTQADFSNFGPLVDVFAPGVDVPGTVIGGVEIWSGSSMSTPLVSGTMALLLSGDPSLTPTQLHGLITSSATQGVIHISPAGTTRSLLYAGK